MLGYEIQMLRLELVFADRLAFDIYFRRNLKVRNDTANWFFVDNPRLPLTAFR